MTTAVTAPHSRCYCGVQRGDITPPVGIYHRMWGAAEHDRSEGVHRPLTATAVFFQPADQAAGDASPGQLLLALDHCLLGPREMDALIAAVADAASLPRDCVSVTFSHTHAAGLMNLDRCDLPGGEMIPAYLRQMTATVAELARQARQESRPVVITYGQGSCSLAAQRDYFDAAAGRYVCGYNPDAAADQTVVVARITAADGTIVATVVNYACHPTTLAWGNRRISPDYPGAARELVEAHLGGVCLFLQGASGELGPVEGFVADTETADRNGRQLGFAALEALTALPPADSSFRYLGAVASGTEIGVWEYGPVDAGRAAEANLWARQTQPVPLPYRADLPRVEDVGQRRQQLLDEETAAREAGRLSEAQRLRALVERETRMFFRLQSLPEGGCFPLHASAWRLGDAVWLAVQGEPYSLLQRALRQRFPSTPLVISTLANGWGPSYLPPRELFGQGLYQERIAVLAPGSLEELIEILGERIQGLLATRPPA